MRGKKGTGYTTLGDLMAYLDIEPRGQYIRVGPSTVVDLREQSGVKKLRNSAVLYEFLSGYPAELDHFVAGEMQWPYHRAERLTSRVSSFPPGVCRECGELVAQLDIPQCPLGCHASGHAGPEPRCVDCQCVHEILVHGRHYQDRIQQVRHHRLGSQEIFEAVQAAEEAPMRTRY